MYQCSVVYFLLSVFNNNNDPKMTGGFGKQVWITQADRDQCLHTALFELSAVFWRKVTHR